MERISKMWRSGLAMLLALCLLISACPVTAFATEEPAPAKKYVSLGDSMTNGYGLSGYDDPYKVNGFLDEVQAAYPYQLQEELGFELTAQLATSAMRAEDLNYILRYPNAEIPDPYCYDEFIENRWDDYEGIDNNKAGVANVAKIFQTNIKDADVISFCVGNANFGVFLLGRLTNALGIMGGSPEGEEWVNFENALGRLDASQKQVAMEAYNQALNLLMSKIPAGAAPLIERLANILGYGVASYLANAEAALDRISELNPDAEIILVGIMNTFAGINLDFVYEGKEYSIPMSAILAPIVNGVNGYLAALPTAKQAMGEWTGNTFYYAEAENVGMIVETYKTEIFKNDNVIRDRFITEVTGMVFDMLNMGLDSSITRADVEAYEDMSDGEKLEFAASNSSKATSIAIYLGFEKAILEAADMKSLNATAFMSLAGDLSKVFDGVLEAMTAGADAVPTEEDLDTIANFMAEAAGNSEMVDSIKTIVNNGPYAAVAAQSGGLLSAQEVENLYVTVQTAREAAGEDEAAADAAEMQVYFNAVSARFDGEMSAKLVERIYNDELDGNIVDIVNGMKNAVAGVETANGVIQTAKSLNALLNMDSVLANALVSDTTVKSLLNLFARMLIGNGIGCHPSAAGHDTLTDAIVKTYEEKHTTKDEVVENVEVALSALKGFLEEYGPEAAEQAYQYLQENGYIDMARTEIEELVKYLNENKDALVEEMIPMIEAAIEALEAQNEELKAVLKSLKAELEALNAELEKASGEAAEQIKQAIAQIEAAIAEIEALIAQVNKQIAELNAAVEELIEAAKAIAEQVEVAIENAEALAESIVALVETLKETGTASVEAIAAAVEQARKTVLLAAETLEQAIELVTTQVADAVAMAEKITEQITALYQDVTSTLDEIIAKLPSDVQGAIKGAAEEIQKALDEAIAGVNADLQKAIDELKATIGAEIDAKKAELEALLDKIDAHVEEKAAGIKAAAEAQIAALKAEAEAKITEINKKLEAEIAKLEAAANAQIDEIKGQIEALKAQAEAQIAKIKAEVEAQIAAIEAIIAEKEAQLKDLYAQLENASAEAKAKIEAQIAAVEAEIAKLEAQIEALKAQAEAQIAKVKAEVEALNAKIQAIIADTQAQIEDLKAQAEAQIETVKAQLKAAVEKINADLKAKIDAIRAEVEATYANAVAALEKAIADLEEKLNAEIAKLKSQAEAQIAKLKAAAEAELEKLNALGQAAADVVNGIIEQVQDQLNTVNETVKAMMNSSVEEAAKLAEKLAEDLKGLGEEALNALVDELNEVLYDAFVKATTADLGLNEESTYIALGDGTAAPESYVEMLGEKLKAEYGVENIVNYAKDGNTVGDEIKAIADREGIADADLITIGFGNVTLVENAFNNAMKDEPASYNWVELVGEELVPYVQDALADIYAEIAAAGLDEETTEMLNIMVEGIAYGAVEYAIELPALINAIRAVNTDAVVIIVGQYNPMDGVVLEFGGMFGAPLVTLDIADYINYLVDGVAAHGIAYSMITGDAIFVEAPQVDTDNTDMSWGLKDLMQFMVYGFGVLNPSESGDGYITNQILEALNISKIEVKPEEPVKPVNPFVDVPEGAFYYDAVMWAVDLGITTGTQDGTTFEPNSPCTRAHIATFLWRAAGCPEPESTVMPFKDVAEGKFYTTAVLWAAENGITNGTGDGTTFEPNATCTRGQIVTMLARYLKGEPTGNDNPFKDVPANAYYTNPVLWAVENGITNGTQDGTTFEPNSPCTRGHIVTFLYRALNK